MVEDGANFLSVDKKGNLILDDLMIDIAIQEEHRSQKLVMLVESNVRVNVTVGNKSSKDQKGKSKIKIKGKTKIQKKLRNKPYWNCGQVGH